MARVELIYDNDCPHVAAARAHLLKAFARTRLPVRWQEWERSDIQAPAYVKHYGSPTILINGQDVGGEAPSGTSCRLYYNAITGHYDKIPSVECIIAALRAANKQQRFSWGRVSSLLPVIFAALLPKMLCPICWTALAGLLSIVGVSVTASGEHNHIPLLPIMIIFLLMVLVTLGYRAKARWGYGPLLVGIIASVMVVVGKYVWDYAGMLYLGIALLVIATLWHSWPRKGAGRTCSACEPATEKKDAS